MLLKRIWALCFLCLFAGLFTANGQSAEQLLDSAFRTLPEGTSKVDSLNELCTWLEDDNEIIKQENRVIQLAQELNYQKGVAQALNNIGIAYKYLGNGDAALKNHQKALKIRESIQDQKGVAASLSNIGNAYDLLGKKSQAIDYHLQALSKREEQMDSLGMARSLNNIASAYLDVPDYYKAIDHGFKAMKIYELTGELNLNYAKVLNNIGLAYERLAEFDKALQYYQKAMEIQEKEENTNEIAKLLQNIGIIYLLQGQSTNQDAGKKEKFSMALEQFNRSLKLLEGQDSKFLEASIYNNIGNTYWGLNEFEKSLSALEQSLKLYRELDSRSDIASALNSLAAHFKLQKKVNESNSYGFKALAIADSINDTEQIKNACEILSDNFLTLKQFDRALEYYKRYVAEKDKLTNVEGAKKLVQEESRLEFEKKEQQLKLEQEKKDAIAEAESKRQRLAIWSVGIGLALVIIFSGFIFNRFRVTQKQKKIIEEQNEQMEEKNKALEIASAEVAQKNKDITDSIQYARRIQGALLASDALLKKNLNEYFVFYKPKDIVSGDFYWATNVGDKFLMITADCTGHGVPGAFMSLLNISLLNEITLQRKITHPDLILNHVREQIIATLNPEGFESEGKDGMDCLLCTYDMKEGYLEFAAANNPIWILRKENGEKKIEEVKPDKQPVGFHSVLKPFTRQQTKINKGDIIYTFTDGFADQFGGPKGKKFKYRQLEELILSISELTMSEQKAALEKALDSWQGSLEQIDDVLVIGVKI